MRKLLLFGFILTGFFLPVKAQQVTLEVHQHEPILISAPFTEKDILQGEKIILGKDLIISGGAANYTTSWSSPGWSADSIQTSITVAPLDTTTYTLKVKDQNNCSVEQIFTVNVIEPIKTDVPVINTSDFTCHVYPNPNNGLFTVEINSELSNTLVLDLLTAEGRSVIRQKRPHSNGKQTLQFGKTNLAEGIYTLQIKFGKRAVSRKLIISR